MSVLMNLLFVLFLIPNILLAQDTEDKPSGEWEKSIGLGLNLTQGNSETTGLNINIKAEKEKDNNIYRFELQENYAENETDLAPGQESTTVDNTKFLGSYQRLLTDRWYLGFNTTYLQDKIADVKYRVTLEPVLGYYFVKNDKMKFSVEAGPGYVFEEVSGISDDYLAPKIGERLEYNLSETAKFYEQVEVLLSVDSSDNYIIKAEAGIEAQVMNGISLTTAIVDNYDNLPGLDRKRNDLSIITSLNYLF